MRMLVVLLSGTQRMNQTNTLMKDFNAESGQQSCTSVLSSERPDTKRESKK